MRRVRSLLLLGILVTAVPVDAATYYLNPASGSDAGNGNQATPWKTLYKVKTSVGAGDTVNVLGGTYTPDQYQGEVGLPRWDHRHRVGAAGAPITIQAAPGAAVIWEGRGESYWQYFAATAPYGGHYVVLQDMTFTHYRGVALGAFGEQGHPVHHLAVRRCRFLDFPDQLAGAITVAGAGGGATHVILQGNTITNMGDRRQGGAGQGSSQHAIYVGQLAQFTVIDGNRVEQVSGYGIHYFGHPGDADGGMHTTSAQHIIRGNIVVNTHRASLIMTGTAFRHTYIYHNTFYNEASPFPAWDAWYGGQAQANGLLYFHHLPASFAQTVILNTLAVGHASDGACLSDQTAWWQGTLRFDHSLCRNAAGPAYQWDAQAHTLPTFQQATALQPQGQAGDPLFTNVAGRDFSLQGGSPALDAGDFLTTTMGSGTGTVLTVRDVGFFHDGYGLVAGDTIQVGTALAQVTAVDYDTNQLTVTPALSWREGEGVSLPYQGARPDMGAVESGGGEPRPLPQPTNLRLVTIP